ncbi:RNase P p30-like protein [Sulfolobus sp. S-194]|uniref:RNase P p30-like protein n=1 Tax=Sulfolobus sp. S-194 TaxID=2512240 RepID=UPI001439188C|nr:RNase P p30-like protein [Sulfolobus sp. S-194]
MLIETCILNSALFNYLKKVGYDYFLSEDHLMGHRRISIEAKNSKSIANFLKSNPKSLVFVKPLSVDALKYSIIDDRISGVILSAENTHIFKKTMLNLIREYEKPVEIQLRHLNSFVLRKFIIWSYKWISFPLISSCANSLGEIWPPLSKINLLVIHGADEEEAIDWIYFSPQRLISKYGHS